MKKRLLDALNNSSEARAYLVYGVLLVLRAWRSIPYLRPNQLLVPVTMLQMVVFIAAAIKEENFFINLAIGNFIVVGLALIPMTFARSKSIVDQVKIKR